MKKHTDLPPGLILAFAVMVSACGSGDRDYQVLETIDSPGGPIILEFARSELAFGTADIRVRAAGEISDTVLYEGRISNDGGAITLDNFRPISSKPGYLWLCLNGVEQEDVAVRIEFETGLVIEDERHCSD